VLESERGQSMIRKKPGPDVIRGADRFSEKIMLKQNGRPLATRTADRYMFVKRQNFRTA
jgi:hypothetical protein